MPVDGGCTEMHTYHCLVLVTKAQLFFLKRVSEHTARPSSCTVLRDSSMAEARKLASYCVCGCRLAWTGPDRGAHTVRTRMAANKSGGAVAAWCANRVAVVDATQQYAT